MGPFPQINVLITNFYRGHRSILNQLREVSRAGANGAEIGEESRREFLVGEGFVQANDGNRRTGGQELVHLLADEERVCEEDERRLEAT